MKYKLQVLLFRYTVSIWWESPVCVIYIRSFQKGRQKQKQKWRFCFFSRFLVPIGNKKQRKKWRPVFENLQNTKMEVHFWRTKTTSKMPFLFLFLISSCQKADQHWVTRYEIQKYFEINECNDVIKAVGSYYYQEPAFINSWKQPPSEGNVWINVRRGVSVINHLSSIIFQISQLASDSWKSLFTWRASFHQQLEATSQQR